MSYAYQLSERALIGLRRMEPWLQEETLDELDRLTADPPTAGRRIGDAIVRDFALDRGPDRFYVFITLFPDAQTEMLRVSDIGSCVLHR